PWPCDSGTLPVSFELGRRTRPAVLEKRRFIIGAVFIAGAVSYLIYGGVRTTSMYYFSLDEFLSCREAHADDDLRVKGWVRLGSMHWYTRTNDLAFELARLDVAVRGPVA